MIALTGGVVALVLASRRYAAIYTSEGTVIAKRAEIRESEVVGSGAAHIQITALLTREQASRMTVGKVYLIRPIGHKFSVLYELIRSDDENLPLRRHTFRSVA